MKINRIKTAKFGSLVVGDCCMYEDRLYIKIDSKEKGLNAFECDENKLTGFFDTLSITPVDVELNVLNVRYDV